MNEGSKWLYMYCRKDEEGNEYYMVDEARPVKYEMLSSVEHSVYVHPSNNDYRYLAPFRIGNGQSLERFLAKGEELMS